MTCKHCDKPVRAHGLCSAHYMKLRRNGDPLKNKPRQGSRPLKIGQVCRNGHLVEGDNVRYRKDTRLGHPSRVVCRICQQEIDRNRARKLRAKKAKAKPKPEPKPMVESTVTTVEGTNLAKSVGIDIRSLTIKPKAMPYWDALQNARARSTDYNCYQREAEFIDYDTKPTPEDAAELCASCPLLLICGQYAKAEKPGWGVWGAAVYGEDDEQST